MYYLPQWWIHANHITNTIVFIICLKFHIRNQSNTENVYLIAVLIHYQKSKLELNIAAS